MRFEEEDLFGFVFFASYQGTTLAQGLMLAAARQPNSVWAFTARLKVVP
jgi:hypothetical protein